MSVRREIALMFAAPLALAGMIAAAIHGFNILPARGGAEVAPAPADWREVAWPFARDQFGPGKAFDCAASACGGQMRVTFRAKIGFCNCATGVADDEELARVGDVDLAGAGYVAGRPGHEIQIGHMKGRAQSHAGAAGAPLLSLAFNDRCDVIVATAVGPDALAREARVIEFLNSAPVLGWAERALGL